MICYVLICCRMSRCVWAHH